MIKKVLSGLLLLSVVSSSSLFAEGNEGFKIPFSTLMKNSSKVDFLYSMGTGTCDTTVDSFRAIWSKYPTEEKYYKSTESVLTYWKNLNEKYINKPITITTGFDNKSFTEIIDGDGVTYYYFNSLKSCQEFSKRLLETETK